MLEIAWIKLDASEPAADPPQHSEITSKNQEVERLPLPTEKKRAKKSRPAVPSKKKKADTEEGHQFSIQIDATPINEDPK